MKPQLKQIHLVLVILIHITSLYVFICCLPNIKIQVNNENLQRPPYLLEAIRRATVAEANLISANNPIKTGDKLQEVVQTVSLNNVAASNSSTKLKSVENGHYHGDRHNTRAEEDSDPNNFSVVKEETIEEILDLEPESVLRLSSDSFINSLPPQDYSKISDMVASSSNIDETDERTTLDLGHSVEYKQDSRKAQLPVTSSHLKRPSIGLIDDDNGDRQIMSETGSSIGAKDLVSPSVAADETPTVNLEKKTGSVPPDTWEPSQVMHGVTNASLVPATVIRQYGHQRRTKITLGGGYIRDKSPPLVDPSSSDYNDDKPEKPVAPLEKPHSSLVEAEKSAIDASRVIEVPERIVLPASVFDKPRKSPNKLVSPNDTSLAINGKLDPRCPSTGVMTLEHPTDCDKYFLCENGHLIEQTCPNGLLYGTRDMVKDYCVHRWQVVCGDKKIPNPISTPGCRWQYGIFNVQGSPKCSPDFYECVEGNFEVRKCPISGQVYDDRTKSCQYAEKVGCAEEALADFHCPPDDQGNTYWPFPRYFLNDRALIHCVNDKPAIVRCRDDERVDPEHLHCVPANKFGTNTMEASAGLVARQAREKKKGPAS